MTKRKRPRTNAERQATYRQRHLVHEDGEGARLNMVIDHHAKCQLKRLARHYGVTHRELLAKLLGQTENRVAGKMTVAKQRAYYSATDIAM